MSAEPAEDSEAESSPEPTSSITNHLNELNDAELITTIEELQTEVTHLELENQVCENFLLKNDPVLLSGMAQILELASKLQSQTQSTLTAPSADRRNTEDSLHSSSRKTESIVRFATTTSTAEKGPRINLSQKMDLAMREMEEMQIALEEFIQTSHRAKCNLKAELEEISIRESEVNEARDIFEQRIVIEGVDSLTQRIPAEKFLRYVEEWLRSAESTVEKMRLRTSTLKSMFLKLSYQLVQKEELGEAIDAVDFDQLRIENQHLAEKIEQKNNHLLELKRMNGIANLVLSTNKKYLQKQVQELQSVKDNIKYKEQRILALDRDSENVEKEVDKVKGKYEDIVNMKENYRVPDVMEYIKIKGELMDLKKNVKMWERKNHIQQFAVNTCIRQMKTITGIKNPHPSWFEMKEVTKGDSSFSLLDDDDENFERPSIISNPSDCEIP